MKSKRSGFTIVELLIVIVVIAILVGIVFAVFSNARSRAQESGIKSELTQAARQLEIDKVENGRYPSTKEAANSGKGLGQSGSIVGLQYTVSSNGDTYCLSGSSGNSAFNVSNGITSASNGVCSGHTAPGGSGGGGGTAPSVTVVGSSSSSCCSTQPNTWLSYNRSPAAGNLLILVTSRTATTSSNNQVNNDTFYIHGWNSGAKVLSGGIQYEVFWKIAGTNDGTNNDSNGVFYTYSDNGVIPRAHLIAEFDVESPYQFTHSGTVSTNSGASSVSTLASGTVNATSQYTLLIGGSAQFNNYNYSPSALTWTNSLANPLYGTPYGQYVGISWAVTSTTGSKSSSATWATSGPTVTSLSAFSLQ